ncbi:Leucine-rich repeat receptor protein kinase EMS1 [Abeliophyllum distichum]|uniref:Leucine-rich repeat receptor protein kinase EMS1 n=1 Tax=Abeliophyllum distichum TaxID=126358 RepID=A0ABD1RDR3_9LAMI
MLPRAFVNLSASIEIFCAYSSGVKGIIPNEIGNMSNLIELDIVGNELTGTIPGTLGQLTKVQRLRLNDNKLQGSIYVNLCHLVNLYHLNLGNNHLSRHLPTCLGVLTSLRALNLSYNSLTLTIPSTMWTNKEIQIMDLSNNLFNGSLAPEIGSVEKNDRVIYIKKPVHRRDSMHYRATSEFGKSNIIKQSVTRALYLSRFGDLISLQYLDLSKNNLYGEIPKSLAET